jgi:hypothetical protein
MSLFNNDSGDDSNTSVDKAKGTLAGVFNSIAGVNKTDGTSALGIIGRNARREIPGFTPNEAYGTSLSGGGWFGDLLAVHPDFSGDSNFKDLSASERFNRSKDFPNFKDNLPDSDQYFSTRD